MQVEGAMSNKKTYNVIGYANGHRVMKETISARNETDPESVTPVY